jgi:hypothetical protein
MNFNLIDYNEDRGEVFMTFNYIHLAYQFTAVQPSRCLQSTFSVRPIQNTATAKDCEIRGSQNSEYEDCLLGCDAV